MSFIAKNSNTMVFPHQYVEMYLPSRETSLCFFSLSLSALKYMHYPLQKSVSSLPPPVS